LSTIDAPPPEISSFSVPAQMRHTHNTVAQSKPPPR
jgi:hypothetical protein